jgi:hypothetical protein
LLTRRESVLGGLLTIIWGCANGTVAAQTPRVRHSFGCMLADDEAGQYLATSHGQQTFTTGNVPIIAGSGNKDFDYALAQTLSRMTDTLKVLPGFGFYDDFDGENAFACPTRRLAGPAGTVLFGKRCFISSMSEPEHPEVAVTAICAHEFGHILQFKRGVYNRLNAGQSTVKRTELHADFLAGYYAGVRKLQKGDYPAAVFATKIYSVGDYRTDAVHHGTPNERAAAIVRGFEIAYRERRSLDQAIQIGINYVSSL